MKTINRNAFKKLLERTINTEKIALVEVGPYFQYEAWYAKHVFLHSEIDEPTQISHYGRKEELILPLGDKTRDTLDKDVFTPYIEELVAYVGIHAPVLSVYSEQKEKLFELRTPY